jgi:hypothetical protein
MIKPSSQRGKTLVSDEQLKQLLDEYGLSFEEIEVWPAIYQDVWALATRDYDTMRYLLSLIQAGESQIVIAEDVKGRYIGSGSIGLKDTMNELPLRPELRSSVAMELERRADSLIELRESLFKFSWKRLIPLPGLFEPIDYDNLLSQSKNLADSILASKKRVESLLDEAKVEKMYKTDIYFLESCRNFCNDSYKENIAIYRILEKLKEKVKNRKAYTKKQYNVDFNSYEQLLVRAGSSYDEMASAYQLALQ